MTVPYVEYLRVTRALRIVAILLGIMLVGAVVIRFSWTVPNQPDAAVRDYYAGLERSPSAHVVRKRLSNGGTRTIVEDPKREVYAIIDRRGSSVVDFTLAHTKERAEDARRQVHGRAEPATSVTTHAMVAYYPFEVGSLFGNTIPMGLLVATLLGGPLSKENNGHLEVAWTKPVSRRRYALTAALVDVLGLVAAQIATALALLAASLLWGVPKLAFESHAPTAIAFAVVAPIAWYAFLTGLSASVKRGPGIVLGTGWVVAIVVPWIAVVTHDASTPVGRSVHAVFEGAGYLIPLSYVLGNAGPADNAGALSLGLAAMAELTVFYLTLALVQWRRLEP
jgi:uncharacterized membrane protein